MEYLLYYNFAYFAAGEIRDRSEHSEAYDSEIINFNAHWLANLES